MKRIAILTSGGDAPGMNAAIRAVVRCAMSKDMEVYGVERGYEGLIDDDISLLSRRDVGGILHRGGTVLGTARSKRFITEEGQKTAADNLKKRGIEGLVIIGGNGSLAGGRDLCAYGITVMGLPGTIDNDLGYTDYTIGYDTALNTVLDAISKIRDTSSSHERTTVVEVMGRDCGDIALYAGLTAGAEYVFVPGVNDNMDKAAKKVTDGIAEGKKHSIIIRAEGSPVSLSEIVDTLNEKTGKETKSIVLSYLQRGGSPSAKDRMLATLCGAKAVELLYDEGESMAIGVRENKIVAIPLKEALEIKTEPDSSIIELIDVLSM